MNIGWLVIVPPLLVVCCALITQRMIASFFVGIVISALIAQHGNIVQASILIYKRFLYSAGLHDLTSFEALKNNWNLSIFLFLCFLGALIVLLQKTGAAQAYAQLVQRKVKSRRSVEIASLVLSGIFFIDDYFSALTVGSVMKPLAALYKLHPLKLAFLVTAMASPVTILSPISSWVGEVILQLKQAGVSLTGNQLIVQADPFYVFVQSIPFIFYALLLVIGTWYIVLRKISYGPMHNHEKSTLSSTTLQPISTKASILDFVFPLLVLIGTVTIMLLITGDYSLFGGTASLIQAFKQGVVHQALFVGGFTALIASILFFLARKHLKITDIGPSLYQGTMLMAPSICMLTFAWTLGTILKQDLQTGAYIAQFLGILVTTTFFPVICFISAGVVATLLGSAWATIGLLFPIVIPMLQSLLQTPSAVSLELVPLLMPIIGATISGAIMGTHFSLMADTPIMAAATTGASHILLVKAMAWYIMPVALATIIAYSVTGFMIHSYNIWTCNGMALILGIITMIFLFESAQFFYKKYTQN